MHCISMRDDMRADAMLHLACAFRCSHTRSRIEPCELHADECASKPEIESSEACVMVQALLALIAQSKVPEEYIEQKQKEQEASDDDADDDLAVAAAAKDKKSNFCLKMLSGIVDPMRQVLSAAKTLYPRKQADGPGRPRAPPPPLAAR